MWVTRAEPGAARTAGRLRALGYEPVVAPLLTIQPIALTEPSLEGVSALVFTSRNGVDAFARLCRRGRALPVFAVGAATAEAASAAGFARVRSADGDVEDLARLLGREAPAGRLLAPGAAEPAGDLAARLPASMILERLPVYRAVETDAPSPAAFAAVLVHSPRAGQALAGRGPFGPGVAVAISPAAASALGSGIGLQIHVAARPDEAALLAALGKAVPPV